MATVQRNPPVQAAPLHGIEAERWSWESRLTQTETLCHVGSWEIDLSTEALNWSEGTYRIFDVEAGRPVTIALALSCFDAATRATISEALEQARHHGKSYDLIVPFTAKTGRKGWVRTLGRFELNRGAPRIVGVVKDVTEERRQEDRLRHLATIDPLTLLPNRKCFEDRLSTVIATSGARSAFGLCLIDLDHFKHVNEMHGHAAGDRLLQEMARRLKDVAPGAGDMVARVGGDEFALLSTGIENRQQLDRMAKTIVERLRMPLSFGGTTIAPAASVGACFKTSTATTAEDALRHADAALHRAKQQGRNQACVFRHSDRRDVEEHGRLLDDVRRGLAQNEFEIFYQPIVDLRTRIVRGWEALIRWRHPEHGLLTPASFMAALLDTRTSAIIDEFVLERGLRQMREWLDEGAPVTCVGVNLSESQLKRPDLAALIVTLLDRYGLTPDRLKVEVLETAFLGQTEAVERTIETLAELGVVSALDDFGTGYASLTHLKQFRVERIKIDRSFIRDLYSDAYDKAIVKSMIDLGRNLGIRVTAEGIETVEQLQLLRDFGCDCGQGYLFGRPMPPDEVPKALSRWYGGEATQIIRMPVAAE